MTDDDESLVAAAQAGDPSALDALLRRHYDRTYALCRRITGNDADALDATQEAMITLVRQIGRFQGSARLTTWSYRVTTNGCLDELRRRRRRPVLGLVAEDQSSRDAPVESLVAERVDVDAALAQLPDEFR